jgi:hypothetical protein
LWPYLGTENVLIPDVSDESNTYPESFSPSAGYAFTCNNIVIENGAHIIVPDLSNGNTGGEPYFNITGNLTVDGKFILPPLGYAKVLGSTTITSTEGIEIKTDATGSGSFIDNGIIYYENNGSVKVQTYLSNSAGIGNFYIHLVGPTIDEDSYTGSGEGALLEAFILDDTDIYAYEWDESGGQWLNIFSLVFEVPSCKGIGLSTIDNVHHILSMTGEIVTDTINSQLLPHTNNFTDLISNPYTSSVNFDSLA